MIEVDFVTLGEASERLNVPAPTLRHWTDQMEDYDFHYVKRNNRNERIYYKSDLEIFAFLRDLKEEHGRRTTTKDLGYMIVERAKSDEMFELRSRDNAPVPKTNKTAELLGQEDIKRLMESERVKQFMEIVVAETTKNIRDEITKEFENKFEVVNNQLQEYHKNLEIEQRERDERIEKRQAERDEKLMQAMNQIMENKKKGFFAKILGK